jgi:hypothetical protein
MEGRTYITIDDDDDDGDSHWGSSTFAPRVAREQEPSLFDSLGDRYNYSTPNVKLEPQETPMETIFERAPETENESQEEPQAPLEEENQTSQVDQAMPDSETQDQENSENMDEEETSKDEVDQTMPDIGTESHDQPEVLPEEEPSVEQPDQAMPNTAAEGLGESPSLVEEDFAKEPVSHPMPDIGTHDQGEHQGPLDEPSLFFQNYDDQSDTQIEQELDSNITLEDNQAADDVDEQPPSTQAGDFATNFGHKISSSGQFKVTGDVSDSEEEQNDEQEDMAENLDSQNPDEDDGTRGDEGAEDYEEHFGEGFGQDFGEDQEQEEAQPVDEEVEGDDQDPDNQENSEQRPDEGDDGSEYEDTDSEEEADNESANATKTPASDAKVPRDKKAKSKNKDPTTAFFAPTAREYFRRKKLAAESKKAGVKRKAETQKSAPPKRKKSANQTGWRDNEPCMRLANKFLETEDLPNAASQGSLPSFGSIKATTQADQFAQIKAKLPKNGDTRRMASQNKDLKMAVKSFGYKRMVADNGLWAHKDMETSLFSYQVTITSWMIERECSGSSPLGGLIGDEMGMGKTLVSLACAVGHPPEPEDIEKFCKATLVIVPNKMIARQWVDEIRKHCKEHIRNLACIYGSGDDCGLDFYEEKFFV